MNKKRTWQSVLLLLIILLSLSGCGSTSSKGGKEPGSTIGSMMATDVQKNQIVTETYGTAFSLSLPFTKAVDDDFRVELHDFGLNVEGCYIDTITYSPGTLVLNGEKGVRKILNITGSFTKKCIVRGYTLHAKQTLVKLSDNSKKTGDIAISKQYGTSNNGYELINIPYQLNITEYERYKIDFQLVHNGIGVPNGIVVEEIDDNTTIERHVRVTIKGFPKQYGTVSSHYGGTITNPTDGTASGDSEQNTDSSQTAQLDSDGIGRFLYSPPAVFPSAGSTYDLELVVYDDITQEILLTQKIQLRFDLKAGASSGTATTLSIVYGYRPPKDGFYKPVSLPRDNTGTGDYHEPAEWDGEHSKLINYYAVHAVNEDGNRPVIGLPITMTLINGVKKLNGNRLKVGTGAIKEGEHIQFMDTSVNFVNADIEDSDKLIIIPSEGKIDPSYLGGWNIDAVYEHTLDLNGMYSNIKEEERLSYLIGNERRLLGRNIVVADVQAIDLESITDEYGMAYFKVTYDPEMVGHTITLEAHTKNEKRVGISRIVKPVAYSRIMGFKSKGRAVENSGSDEMTFVKLYIGVDTSAQARPGPLNEDADTTNLYPLADLDIDPNSFRMKPDDNSTVHCSIDREKSDFHVSIEGSVALVIQTDGNTSKTGGVDTCSVVWDGSEEALGYDYEY